MLIDLHVHSHLSHQGILEPEEIILKAKNLGLDGVCFTEDRPISQWEELLKLGEIHEVTVLLGRVLATDHGHFLFYPQDPSHAADEEAFAPSEAGAVYPSFEDLSAAAQKLGGILAAAHPYKQGVDNPLGDRIFQLEGLDAIETRNGSCPSLINDFALEASFHLKLACIGGSGTLETLSTIGKAATLFLNEINGQEDLIQALKSKEVWPIEIGDEIKLRPVSSRGDGDRGGRGRGGDRGGRGGDRGGRGGGRSGDRGRGGRSGGGDRGGRGDRDRGGRGDRGRGGGGGGRDRRSSGRR